MTPLAEKWLQDGRALLLPQELSEALDRHISKLPWVGFGLDWSKMPPAERINVSKASLDDKASWIARTRLANHKYVVVWFSRAKGGVVVNRDVGLQRLDALYSGAPGIRFVFGADVDGQTFTPDYTAILQYQGDEDEWVAVSRLPRLLED